ncbi:MAG TPA: LysR family transcriptional regulator, partial [Alloacidobacterium sp.]|nr:LysR family transcriptional regulator [Alloacidobacterium sp.]
MLAFLSPSGYKLYKQHLSQTQNSNPLHWTFSGMDFEQLRTFLEVSRLKSFSRAAEKLGVTQPAISAQIR